MTPDRHATRNLTTPSAPSKVNPQQKEPRPEHILTRIELAKVIYEEVLFAQKNIVARIDYILNELKTETNPVRRKQGWALLQRLAPGG